MKGYAKTTINQNRQSPNLKAYKSGRVYVEKIVIVPVFPQ